MKRLLGNIVLLMILGLVALGHLRLVSAGEVAILAAAYFVAFILNLHVMVPRLLLKGHFGRYVLLLLLSSAVLIALEAKFSIDDDYGNPWRVVSGIMAYMISVAGAAILFFLHLWNQSGHRLHDLRNLSAQRELDDVRVRVDSDALFATLKTAAEDVEREPERVSQMLRDLSLTLRKQLYESSHAPYIPIPSEPESRRTLDLWSPGLNRLVDKRYAWMRHTLLVLGFVLLVMPNFAPPLTSFLGAFLFPLSIFLGLSYLNIYVMVPRLLLKGRIKSYIIIFSVLLLVFVAPAIVRFIIAGGFVDNSTTLYKVLFIVAQIVKVWFPITGINVVAIFARWVRNERHIARLETEATIAELEQLQNQVNPHFLFNMLNNIIVLTRKDPAQAADTLRKLNGLLEYQFRSQSRVSLGDEIAFLEDYLNLEKLRRDRFDFNIEVRDVPRDIELPPLLFIPFVENAVKHGNDNRNPSFVTLSFALCGEQLTFVCANSKPLIPVRRDGVGGLGLPNVKRRLGLLYGDKHSLEITETDTTYTVRLTINPVS